MRFACSAKGLCPAFPSPALGGEGSQRGHCSVRSRTRELGTQSKWATSLCIALHTPRLVPAMLALGVLGPCRFGRGCGTAAAWRYQLRAAPRIGRGCIFVGCAQGGFLKDAQIWYVMCASTMLEMRSGFWNVGEGRRVAARTCCRKPAVARDRQGWRRGTLGRAPFAGQGCGFWQMNGLKERPLW